MIEGEELGTAGHRNLQALIQHHELIGKVISLRSLAGVSFGGDGCGGRLAVVVGVEVAFPFEFRADAIGIPFGRPMTKSTDNRIYTAFELTEVRNRGLEAEARRAVGKSAVGVDLLVAALPVGIGT